jgi:hypothetical protein
MMMTGAIAETFSPPVISRSGSIDRLFGEARIHLTPDMTGRIVTRGFSYLSRIGKGRAGMRLWEPPAEAQKAAPQRLDWVSIKQIEILQEAGDNAIESLEIESGLWSIREMITMRAGGVRLVVITAGYSNPPKTVNDQKKLDGMLDSRLRNFDRMQWFDEMSHSATDQVRRSGLNIEERLPHVFTTMDAADVFGHTEKLDCANIRKFLEQIADVPVTKDINHTVMMGLKSPRSDLFNRRQFNRLSDRMQIPFMSALRMTYAHFGLSVHSQMRGYGDHMHGNIANYKQPRATLAVPSFC